MAVRWGRATDLRSEIICPTFQQNEKPEDCTIILREGYFRNIIVKITPETFALPSDFGRRLSAGYSTKSVIDEIASPLAKRLDPMIAT